MSFTTVHNDAPLPGSLPQHLAVVAGEPLHELPGDLYVPPQALEVFLDSFEGPLDFLLYLIRRQNVDILEVDVAAIATQYISYIDALEVQNFALAADYLVMAARLAEIKSKMLLPREIQQEEEDDPRADLLMRLQEYDRYRRAAIKIDGLPRLERDIFLCQTASDVALQRPKPQVDLEQLLRALAEVLERNRITANLQLSPEPLSMRERMSHVMARLSDSRFLDFRELLDTSERRPGIIVTFMAIMELLNASLIEIVQGGVGEPLHIRLPARDDD